MSNSKQKKNPTSVFSKMYLKHYKKKYLFCGKMFPVSWKIKGGEKQGMREKEGREVLWMGGGEERLKEEVVVYCNRSH